MTKANQTIQSTQKYLNILAIKDGIVVLKDGGIRLLLKVSSLNFALKSEEEQSGLISQYQGFLNALKFDIQIIMQSRRLDLYNYLRYLKEVVQNQTNDMVRIQTDDYINYIERLLTKANIMDKRFFVIIPFFPMGTTQGGWMDKLLGGSKTGVQYSPEQFKSYQEQLWERANVVIEGLGGLGLKVTPLGTQEIIEVMYSIYNPEEAMNERMVEASGLEAPIIESMNNATVEKGKEEETGGGSTSNTPAGETNSNAGAVDGLIKPVVGNPQVPAGAEIKIGGQNFYATPQTVQSLPIAPEENVTGESGTSDEPMTKEKADQILGKVLDTVKADDKSAGAQAWPEKNGASPVSNPTVPNQTDVMPTPSLPNQTSAVPASSTNINTTNTPQK